MVAVVMSNQDRLNVLIPNSIEKLFRFPGGINQDAFIGLRAGNQVTIVHHGTHSSYLGDLYFAVIVQSHMASPVLVSYLQRILSAKSNPPRLQPKVFGP